MNLLSAFQNIKSTWLGHRALQELEATSQFIFVLVTNQVFFCCVFDDIEGLTERAD